VAAHCAGSRSARLFQAAWCRFPFQSYPSPAASVDASLSIPDNGGTGSPRLKRLTRRAHEKLSFVPCFWGGAPDCGLAPRRLKNTAHQPGRAWRSGLAVDPTDGDNVDGDDLPSPAVVAALGPQSGSVVVVDPATGRPHHGQPEAGFSRPASHPAPPSNGGGAGRVMSTSSIAIPHLHRPAHRLHVTTASPGQQPVLPHPGHAAGLERVTRYAQMPA